MSYYRNPVITSFHLLLLLFHLLLRDRTVTVILMKMPLCSVRNRTVISPETINLCPNKNI